MRGGFYTVTKTYGAERGLSAIFRQWKAESHCRFLHGYALSFEFEVGAITLNDCNWVFDFGGFKRIKAWLEDTFDHRLLIAFDDPKREELLALGDAGLAQPLVVPATGCEAFARMAADTFIAMFEPRPDAPSQFRLMRVTVREHSGNAATYEPANRAFLP